MKRASFFLCFPVCAWLLVTGTGCHYIHDLGTGTHLDAPRDHPYDPEPSRERKMVVEVTTDPQGNVEEIHFQRSSGKEGIDAYVAESIRQSWPRQPSTRSVASLTYSTEKGFTPPKLLSSTPL